MCHINSFSIQGGSILINYIPNFNAMIPNIKEENIKIAPSQKWKFYTAVPLYDVSSEKQNRLPLQHMAKKMVLVITEK